MRRVFTGLIFFILSIAISYNAEAAAVDYTSYAKILHIYVNTEGRVDYKGLLQHRDMLDTFIRDQIEEADLSDKTPAQKKAFWINAYNALTLRLILDHYPPPFGQIRGIHWGRPWSLPMRAAGRDITLNDIEHKILRKWQPPDPRIHFAINCASIGCPKLPDVPFLPQTLDQQLNQQAVRFNNDPEKVRLDRTNNILYHSAIYKWFKEDFVAQKGSILDFILQYINPEDRAYLQKNRDKIKLRTIPYDWGLNKQ